MTTQEYLQARKRNDWKFNRVVNENAFLSVNRIHPIKQKTVAQIVEQAKNALGKVSVDDAYLDVACFETQQALEFLIKTIL